MIASPDASRRHAEIVSRPDGEVLVDLSTNGTFVNGTRIHGRHHLKPLDVIRIGAEEFRFYPAPKPEPAPPPRTTPPPGAEFRLGDTLIGIPTREPILPRNPPSSPLGPSSPRAAPPRPLATLLIKSGSLQGQRFAVTSPVVNLGRADYNDIRIPDASVSSSHAKLTLREGVWSLVDLGSTNGTTVDGMAVSDEAPLSPASTIKLGEVLISFEPHDEGVPRSERTTVLPRAAEVVTPAPTPIRSQERPAENAVEQAEPETRRPSPAPTRTATVVLIVGIVILLAALAALVLFL